MKHFVPEVPRLMLGVSSLDQPVRTTRDRQLEVASRFKESESLAVALVKAVGAGAEALVVPPTNDVREALAELKKDLPLVVRTPHTPVSDDLRWEPPLAGEIAEDGSWSPGGAGAAAMNLLPLSMAAELVSRVLPRMERESATFSARSLRGVMLPGTVTDLALAAGQPRFFERVIKSARHRFRMIGLETHNLGHLLERLATWNLAPDFVMGAVNPRGVGMMPDTDTVLAAIKASQVKVIANELRAGGLVTLDEGVRYARQRGVWGVCAELVDL